MQAERPLLYVGGGVVLSKVIIEDVVGLPIHYTVLVDFSGFTISHLNSLFIQKNNVVSLV